MHNHRNDLSADYVRSILDYNPETGVLTWKRSVRKGWIGKHIGWEEITGAHRLRIKGKTYLGSRIAWLIVTGQWPTGEVDHKNNDKSDNRWINLRLATSSQNNQNRRLMRNNASGYKGVHQIYPGKWQARITINKNTINLGCFDSPEAAYRAYQQAAPILHKDFYNPG